MNLLVIGRVSNSQQQEDSVRLANNRLRQMSSQPHPPAAEERRGVVGIAGCSGNQENGRTCVKNLDKR